MDSVGRLRSLAAAHWRKALLVTAGLGLVALIAVTLAQLLWLVIDGPRIAVAPAKQTPVAALPEPPRYTPADAASWHLFGDAAAAGAVATTSDSEAPATRLSLQLLGVFSSADTRLAGAVIAERGRDGELFRVGATLPGGATLDKVEAKRVLIRRRGQVEALSFDSSEGPGVGSPAASAAGAAPGLDLAAGFRGLRDRLGTPPPDDDEADTGGPNSRARSALAGLANDLRSNPEGVMGELGLRTAGGGGYVVGEGPSADLLRNMGLRAGDVVISVNGKPVGNVHAEARLVDEVKASGEARVEIRRGSQTFTVNYPL